MINNATFEQSLLSDQFRNVHKKEMLSTRTEINIDTVDRQFFNALEESNEVILSPQQNQRKKLKKHNYDSMSPTF